MFDLYEPENVSLRAAGVLAGCAVVVVGMALLAVGLGALIAWAL